MAAPLTARQIPPSQQARVQLFQKRIGPFTSAFNAYWSVRMGRAVSLAEGAGFDRDMRAGRLAPVWRGDVEPIGATAAPARSATVERPPLPKAAAPMRSRISAAVQRVLTQSPIVIAKSSLVASGPAPAPGRPGPQAPAPAAQPPVAAGFFTTPVIVGLSVAGLLIPLLLFFLVKR